MDMLLGVGWRAKSKVPPWVDTAYFGGYPRSCSAIPHDPPTLSPESLAITKPDIAVVYVGMTMIHFSDHGHHYRAIEYQ